MLHHHERVDGSGYPNGLKGSEISLEGSIIAVSEVVAAMSFYRPYREKYGTEYALSEIITNCGSLYRTEVAEACSNVFSKGFAFDGDSSRV
ncbi:HD-GYP domain-containing protein [Mesotoga sp.]|uniref:HD-GYP domain-containing protein n=1 Tax=Mesotoga sp. TaxID=2053577 RepID=UPI00345E72FF